MVRPWFAIFIAVIVLTVLLSGCAEKQGTVPTPTPTASAVTETTTPTPFPENATLYLAEGEREGPLLVQKIYSDHIEGLNFIEYPLATEKGAPITLHVGQSASNGCNIFLTLVSINHSRARFLKKVEPNRPCPICLSENTYIDTPSGGVLVKDLKEGASIWTSDSSGHRRIAVVMITGRVKVPEGYRMVHFVLSDGRELSASPGHKLADGRTLGSILPGDIVDGAQVIIAESIPYKGDYTYDILPSGDTGTYWANGILVRSTII